MLASVRVRVTHLLLRVLSRARECSLARSAFWHASVSRVSRERLARFVTFLVSGTVHPPLGEGLAHDNIIGHITLYGSSLSRISVSLVRFKFYIER